LNIEYSFFPTPNYLIPEIKHPPPPPPPPLELLSFSNATEMV
jgi:hypothetical protein